MSVFLFQHHLQEMGPALGKVVSTSAHRCLVEGIPLEQEISFRDDSEAATFFPMEKCMANAKEKHKEEQPGEEDTRRPQRLQSPYLFLSAPTYKIKLKAGCSQQEPRANQQFCLSWEFMSSRAERCPFTKLYMN